MVKVTLRDLVDDILLIVRNNNISESEDFSRALIILWIKHYRAALWRERLDRLKELAKNLTIDWQMLIDDLFLKQIETGPMELEEVEPMGDQPIFTKRTIDTLENVFNNDPRSILAVHDQTGENIQYMDHIRRHYQYFRKYTFGEMTAFYKDDGHVYVQGTDDDNQLKYIWVLWLQEQEDAGADDDNDDDADEDDIEIPAWMVPYIKDNILKRELAFMLNRPSDDSNNATLASVKPHGPQDDEQ